MKKIIYTLLICIFLMNSFVMLASVSYAHNPGEPCLFETVLGGYCDMSVGATMLALHHTNEVKSVSEALPVFTSGVFALLLLIVIFLFFDFRNHPGRVYFKFFSRNNLSIFTLNTSIRWIILHNKINPHLIFLKYRFS